MAHEEILSGSGVSQSTKTANSDTFDISRTREEGLNLAGSGHDSFVRPSGHNQDHLPAISPPNSFGASEQHYYHPSNYPPLSSPAQASGYGFYSYPPGGWGTWPMAGSQYDQTGSAMPASATLALPCTSGSDEDANRQPSTSEPAPPWACCKNWDTVIKSFLTVAGFTQALKGFEADMVVMNPEWERRAIPVALGGLIEGLTQGNSEQGPETSSNGEHVEVPFEDRRLTNVHFAIGATPRSHSSVAKSISRFLAQNRARNDSSNRNEFLLSLADKRHKMKDSSDTGIPSCARTDAKTQNRDIQMKYDIAKNEDGPLRKTIQPREITQLDREAPIPADAFEATAEQHPGLDERLRNIEAHLAIRYVPSIPRSLLDRLRFLEDHIIHLEKEYPPWAALHFNQPHRGWPPPPRPTPIIVPSHLTSTAPSIDPPRSTQPTPVASAPGTPDVGEPGHSKPKTKPGRNTKSSLHRAVMERLEVQKAMNDLAGGGNGDG